MTLIAPSILSADFGKLSEEITRVEEAGADLIHIDVMDGHFVPNLTYGPVIISRVKELTKLPLDVHLMITNAEATVDNYIDAGADYISVHQEAVFHLQRLLTHLKSRGCKAGVALNPATKFDQLEWVMDDLDYVLIMTVNPGFGAQKFIPASLDKIRDAKRRITDAGKDIAIQVDGGISPDNIKIVSEAGAEIFVAGNAVFKAPSPADVIGRMKELCNGK
jgi:ribulose-phosphate 3-epimerase